MKLGTDTNRPHNVIAFSITLHPFPLLPFQPNSIATRWMVLALQNAAHWPAYRVRVAMALPASRLNQTSWTRTATRLRNGNANAQPATWGRHVRYLSVRTIPVNMVALVFNFRAAVTSVSVPWASMDITASTVSSSSSNEHWVRGKQANLSLPPPQRPRSGSALILGQRQWTILVCGLHGARAIGIFTGVELQDIATDHVANLVACLPRPVGLSR